MPRTYTCRDVGVDCDWRTTGATEEEVMRNVREHARATHNLQEIPQDLERQVRAAIKEDR
jgi:predicted small metal-binding protein